MHAELSVALNFIISHLYTKLPRRRVDVFREELQRGFELRFSGHWYPDDPTKGSGFRCVKLAADKVDPVVDAAAKASGLDIVEIKCYLPAGLTIWIDPGEVSCRLTENGPVQVIYRGGGAASDASLGSARRRAADGDEVVADGELQRVCWGYDSLTPGARPQDLSPSSGWSPTGGGGSGGGASPVAGGTTRVLPPPPTTTTCFTAATFAQTKFGSTKMKSQGPQRPSRLSPTETVPSGFPARMSPSSAPLPACWGLSPAGGMSPTVGQLSPIHQSPSSQLAMMPSAGAVDARPAGLQEWIVLRQHQHQQQMQYLAALKQQQQQRGMTSSGHHPLNAPAPLTPPHHHDAPTRQHLHLTQLQQPMPQQSIHGLVTSPDVGMFPTRDADVTSGLRDDGVRMSPGECIDWGLDVAVPGYATGLQQLLLAN